MRARRLIIITISIGLLISLTMILKEVKNDMMTTYENTAIASDNFTFGIPLLDTEAPLEIETATFALG